MKGSEYGSPYLKENQRLGDVIAAIQAMSTYKYYKLTFEKWSDRITGSEETAEHWKRVFIDHPEFFRLDSKREKASLVKRRQHQKLYSVDTEKQITKDEYNNLDEKQKEKISRTPLSSEEILC